jgi:hypothetical protein
MDDSRFARNGESLGVTTVQGLRGGCSSLQPLWFPDEGDRAHHRSTTMPQDTSAPHQDRRRPSRPGRLRAELIIPSPLPLPGRCLVVPKHRTAPSEAPDCTITPPGAGFLNGRGSDGRTDGSECSRPGHSPPLLRTIPRGELLSVPTNHSGTSGGIRERVRRRSPQGRRPTGVNPSSAGPCTPCRRWCSPRACCRRGASCIPRTWCTI